MRTLIELLVLSILCVAATGCGTLQRLGINIGPDEAKTGIRLILDREGYSDALTNDEISQLVDWVQEDWERDQERQAFLDGIASRQENEARILELAGKYYPGGQWNLPMRDVPAADITNVIEFAYGAHKGANPEQDTSVVLRSVTRANDNLVIDCDPLASWEKWTDNGKEVNGWVARAMADGKGGTFEMCRTNPGTRSLSNIHEGYRGHPDWTADEWVAIVNRDGTKRSNWVKVNQP